MALPTRTFTQLHTINERGTKTVKHAKCSSDTQSPRTGAFATLRAFLRAEGSSAPSISGDRGSGRLSFSFHGDSAASGANAQGSDPHARTPEGGRMISGCLTPADRKQRTCGSYVSRWAVLGVSLLGLLVPAVNAASAQAEGPWWHLTSGARPAAIQPGIARSEVRSLAVQATSGEYVLEEPVLLNRQSSEGGPVEGESFVKLPFNASAAEVQAGLEEMYGAGNVVVAEAPAGSAEFTVTFVGEKADLPVELKARAGEVTLATLTRGRADGELYLTATNLGDQPVSGESVPVKFADTLPAGLRAVAIAATRPNVGGEVLRRVPLPCSLAALTCTLTGNLAAYDQLELRILVVAEPGAQSGETNQATISGGEGFTCEPVPAGSGKYLDFGCTFAKPGGGFERAATGPAPTASVARPVPFGSAVPFGVELYELQNEAEGGGLEKQAGSHPFQSTTTVVLNQGPDARPLENVSHKPSVNPTALPKDLHFQWPPGLIGNPSVVPECTTAEFYTTRVGGAANGCPAQSAVGVAVVMVNEPSIAEVADLTVPLFNLEPAFGEPARFGFNVVTANTPVVIDTALRSDGDYGVTVQTNNITQTASLLLSEVTVWGNPGDPRHNGQRGSACLLESRGAVAEGLPSCTATETVPGGSFSAFLTTPTSCAGPAQSTVLGDSWADPLDPVSFPALATTTIPAYEGCNQLPFGPKFAAETTSRSAASPTGLNVDINLPGEGLESSGGRAESEVHEIVVDVPKGITTNPAVANGLSACTLAQYEAEAIGNQSCPESSKVGEVEIESPLVKPIIKGNVYVAKQGDNPFHNLLSIYVVAKNPELGVLIKQAGRVEPNPQTGQLHSVFDSVPQLPFDHLHFAFRSGNRAPLIAPNLCGKYTTGADFYPYSNPTVPVHRDATFEINGGAGGQPCASSESQLPNKPTLEAGTLTPIAGAYSPFVFKVNRADGSQTLSTISATLPEGLLGKLAGVSECSSAAIAQATSRGGEGQGAVELASPSCPASSQVGVVNVGTGVGTQPYYVQGKAYLAGPYKGAPLSLAIITPAVVGPFDLGTIVVRTALYVNETTAQITAKSDPIPTIVHGLPTVVQSIALNMSKPNFTLNPTSCEPKQITGSAISTLGVAAPLQQRFQVGACGALGFKPSLKLSLKGATKRSGVPALKAVLTYPKGDYANIKSVSTVLPRSEFIDNAHIGNTCTRVQFNSGAGQGAQCPANSLLGHAKAWSPLLDKPLEGNVYLRSNGGERELPDIVAALKGQIPVTLVGFIDSVKKSKNSEVSRLRTRFMNVPDAPVSRFVLQLAGAKHGLLENSQNLCKVKNIAQVKAVGQNGATYDTEPAVANDCGKKHKQSKGKKSKAGKNKGGK
jgi:hypothetical protein